MDFIELAEKLAEEASEKMLEKLKKKYPKLKIFEIFRDFWEPWNSYILPYEYTKIPDINGTMVCRFDDTQTLRVWCEFESFEDMGKMLDYVSEQGLVLETETESYRIVKLELGDIRNELFDEQGNASKELNIVLRKI